MNPFPTFEHRNTATAINGVKAKHRSKLRLEDWTKMKYAKKPEVMEKLRRIEGGVLVEQIKGTRKNNEIIKRRISDNKPILIKGGCERWPAMREKRWEVQTLLRRLRHNEFKIGECDEGRKLRVKFKYFVDYMRKNEDDSPLYLFESALDYEVEHSLLNKDFNVPTEHFPNDLLNLCGREHKPPYKWFCIGPERSGTTVHKDPLGTSAWNAVTSGRKRWVLFEPEVQDKIATGRSVRNKGEGSEAIDYFYFLLDRVKREYKDVQVYECIQEPGDIIYVPAGWWHGVVNLEDSVAMTQNYCGADNFDKIYARMKRDRPGLCERWVKNMRKWRSPLWKRVKWLEKNISDVAHGDTSDSDDSSEYSSSDEEEDIDWVGLDCEDLTF
jgi:histone arginine demethylase JMJD6